LNNLISIAHDLKQKLQNVAEHNHHAQSIAWWLLEKMTGKSKASLLSCHDIIVTDDQKKILQTWVYQLTVEHKPLQYILQTVTCGDVTLFIEPPLFIPRPETEEWCLALIKECTTHQPDPFTVLDLCTGPGTIALMIAKGCPPAQVTGIDKNPHAVAVAHRNKEYNTITNATFTLSNLFSNLEPLHQFDLIVSNPPYVSEEEWRMMNPSITQWEDKDAFVAAQDGYAVYYEIIDKAPLYLKKRDPKKHAYPLPHLVLEIGETQGEKVANYLQKKGFSAIKIIKDFAGKNRVIQAFLTDF
jgi:release factor glutamine methyltransferase